MTASQRLVRVDLNEQAYGWLRERIVTRQFGPGERLEALGTEGVQTDGEALEPGLPEFARPLREERPVGGHRQVLHLGAGRQPAHQDGERT